MALEAVVNALANWLVEPSDLNKSKHGDLSSTLTFTFTISRPWMTTPCPHPHRIWGPRRRHHRLLEAT